MKWRNIRPSASQKYVNAAPLQLHSEKFEGDFSVKIIQYLKKSVIVKLLFNKICITVVNTVQLYKLEVSLPKPKDATSIKFIRINEKFLN